MKRNLLILVVIAFLAALLGSFVTYSCFIQKTNPVQAEPTIKPAPAVQVAAGHSGQIIGSDAVVNASDKIGPSVVSITVQAKVAARTTRKNNGSGERFFFFDPYDEYQFGPRERRGSGSGIILSSDGLILTNQHVIENADQIKVKIGTDNNNGQLKEYDAKVIGQDKLTDVAIIKIDADNLTPAALGDSDTSRVGEWVIAVGNPLGYEHTVTVGVLSAKGRDLQTLGEREYPNLLQTDAAINPGNSGGPLANLQGEVIGMNTIISATGQGIGFAIPINRIKKIKDQLISNGRVVRAYIGIQMQPMDEAKAEYLGMSRVEGVLVFRVLKGTPADKAGLERGDVILEIDGEKINSPAELQKKVRDIKPGEKITLKVWRDKKVETVEAEVGEMPDAGTFMKQNGEER